MELDKEERNFYSLLLLLIKVGNPKLREFFIKQWNAVKGHVPWNDSTKNGKEILRTFDPLPSERHKVEFGNTLYWNLVLTSKVLLHSSPPLVTRRSQIKAIKYLKDLREEFGRERITRIGAAEFEKKWNDACSALNLLGARSKDFKKVKKDVKKPKEELYQFLCHTIYGLKEEDIKYAVPKTYSSLAQPCAQRYDESPDYDYDTSPIVLRSAKLPSPQGIASVFGGRVRYRSGGDYDYDTSPIVQQSGKLPAPRRIARDIRRVRGQIGGGFSGRVIRTLLPSSGRPYWHDEDDDYDTSATTVRSHSSKLPIWERGLYSPEDKVYTQGSIISPFDEEQEFYAQGSAISPIHDEDEDERDKFVGEAATSGYWKGESSSKTKFSPEAGLILDSEEFVGEGQRLKMSEDGYEILIDDEFGVHRDISVCGMTLDVPPKAVTRKSFITCKVLPDNFSPTPVGENESLVSYIVELSPSNIYLRMPIVVTLVHSGAERELGYEAVVKAFNTKQQSWEELKEYKSFALKPYTTDSIQVQISKLTTLAVISRLITDRFEVTPSGCVVRSSVCNDVAVEFPEGAVDKTVTGSMKLFLMPANIHYAKDAFPILSINGFSGVKFLKPVSVRFPPPIHEEYPASKIHLLCLDDSVQGAAENQWKDITDQARIVKSKFFIEFYVQHFSCLWPWKSSVHIKFASTIYRYLRGSPPQAVCFAAFKDNEVPTHITRIKMTLLCFANHKQYEAVSNMKDEGHTRLAVATADRKMRPDDKAYTTMNGATPAMTNGRFFLRFLKNEICRKELHVRESREPEQKQEQEIREDLVLNFFPDEEENLNLLLCTLQMSKEIVFPYRGREKERNPLTDQVQNIEKEVQPVEDALATMALPYLEEEVDEVSDMHELVCSFGALNTLNAAEVAESLPKYLNVDRSVLQDPPDAILKKCQGLCRWLKDNGRKDVVKELRRTLPSGMTGPLRDGNILIQDLDNSTKLKLTRALSVKDEWKIFAQNIGISTVDIEFYCQRTRNPVLEIFNDLCGNMKIGQLYRLLVKSGANAIADYL